VFPTSWKINPALDSKEEYLKRKQKSASAENLVCIELECSSTSAIENERLAFPGVATKRQHVIIYKIWIYIRSDRENIVRAVWSIFDVEIDNVWTDNGYKRLSFFFWNLKKK